MPRLICNFQHFGAASIRDRFTNNVQSCKSVLKKRAVLHNVYGKKHNIPISLSELKEKSLGRIPTRASFHNVALFTLTNSWSLFAREVVICKRLSPWQLGRVNDQFPSTWQVRFVFPERVYPKRQLYVAVLLYAVLFRGLRTRRPLAGVPGSPQSTTGQARRQTREHVCSTLCKEIKL